MSSNQIHHVGYCFFQNDLNIWIFFYRIIDKMKTIVAVLFALFAFTIALPHGDLLSTRFVGGLGKKGGFSIPTKGFTIPTKGIGLGINEALLASPLLINAGLGKSALLS